jgi:Na+/proline symporter
LFAFLAVEIKRKAPTCHTVLEVVRARWGAPAHATLVAFCLVTNCAVTAMLLVSGASAVEYITGVSFYAAAFILPVGVMFYTGGCPAWQR